MGSPRVAGWLSTISVRTGTDPCRSGRPARLRPIPIRSPVGGGSGPHPIRADPIRSDPGRPGPIAGESRLWQGTRSDPRRAVKPDRHVRVISGPSLGEVGRSRRSGRAGRARGSAPAANSPARTSSRGSAARWMPCSPRPGWRKRKSGRPGRRPLPRERRRARPRVRPSLHPPASGAAYSAPLPQFQSQDHAEPVDYDKGQASLAPQEPRNDLGRRAGPPGDLVRREAALRDRPPQRLANRLGIRVRRGHASAYRPLASRVKLSSHIAHLTHKNRSYRLGVVIGGPHATASDDRKEESGPFVGPSYGVTLYFDERTARMAGTGGCYRRVCTEREVCRRR